MIKMFYDHRGKVSVKRVHGSIGYIAALIMAFCGVNNDTVLSVLLVSSGLLGMDTVFDIFKNYGHRENK